MNQFLQNNLIAIIVFLLLIIFLLMGAMIFMLFRLLTRPKDEIASIVQIAEPKITPALEKVIEKHYCSHHPDSPSVGSCLICEDVFCEECLVEHDSMHFCKEHFRIFANNKWKQITDVRTTPDTPEDGIYIYNFKKDLWSNKQIPTLVMTHYKINIENDYIESFIQLNVREDDAEKLTNELLKYKAPDYQGFLIKKI